MLKETTEQIHCKYCNGNNIIKFGMYKQIQRYWCKECCRKFTSKRTLFKMKTPTAYITESIALHREGYSLRRIARSLSDSYGINVTPQAIFKWIQD